MVEFHSHPWLWLFVGRVRPRVLSLVLLLPIGDIIWWERAWYEALVIARCHLIDWTLWILIIKRSYHRAVVIHNIDCILIPIILHIFLINHLLTLKWLLIEDQRLFVIIFEAVLSGLSKFHAVISGSPVQLNQLHLTLFHLVFGCCHRIYFLSLVFVWIGKGTSLS